MKRGKLKNILRKLGLLKFVSFLLSFFKKKYSWQTDIDSNGFKIKYFGTKYGGWSFVEDESLENSIIISAGLGEDASFDIEFASKYNARIIFVDPTPRAIDHYDQIIDSLGKPSSKNYTNHGKQPIEAYNLSKFNEENFTLVKKALWNKNEKIKFYNPINPNHVSHSISNFQNNYSKDTSFIKVQSITIDKLLNDLEINKQDITLMKLDIEGAEIEVINDCMNKGFLPRQILVEFDELSNPSKNVYMRVTEIHDLLTQNKYKLLRRDGISDFLYYRS